MLRLFGGVTRAFAPALVCLTAGTAFLSVGCAPKEQGTVKIKAADFEKKLMGPNASSGEGGGSSLKTTTSKSKFQVKSIKNRVQE